MQSGLKFVIMYTSNQKINLQTITDAAVKKTVLDVNFQSRCRFIFIVCIWNIDE
jgi:hypothetical protein